MIQEEAEKTSEWGSQELILGQLVFKLGLDSWEDFQHMVMRREEVSLREQHEQKQGDETLAD